MYGDNNPASKIVKYFNESVSNQSLNEYRRVEALYLRSQMNTILGERQREKSN